jgi:hypothetical protein
MHFEKCLTLTAIIQPWEFKYFDKNKLVATFPLKHRTPKGVF